LARRAVLLGQSDDLADPRSALRARSPRSSPECRRAASPCPTGSLARTKIAWYIGSCNTHHSRLARLLLCAAGVRSARGPLPGASSRWNLLPHQRTVVGPVGLRSSGDSFPAPSSAAAARYSRRPPLTADSDLPAIRRAVTAGYDTNPHFGRAKSSGTTFALLDHHNTLVGHVAPERGYPIPALLFCLSRARSLRHRRDRSAQDRTRLRPGRETRSRTMPYRTPHSCTGIDGTPLSAAAWA
jgi:hypothetical protein